MASYFDEPDEYGSGAFVTIDFNSMLREDHPAMLIKKFISTVNIKPFKKRYKVGRGKKGRAPKGIRMMIGLILYGMYSRIYSAHKIDYASYSYSDFWIFTHKQRISHDKVSDFLNMHGDQLISVFLETIVLSEKNDYLKCSKDWDTCFFSFYLNTNKELSTHKNRQVLHVADLFVSHDAVRGTLLAGTGCTSRSVDEELHLGREVVVNNILQ